MHNSEAKGQYKSDDMKNSMLPIIFKNLNGDFQMSGPKSADLSVSINPDKILDNSIFIRFRR